MLLLLTSHNSSVLFPVFFFLIFFFFSMPVTDPRCQIAAAAGCMTDPLGCSWVNTPGLILAVSYRWYADDFSDLSCFSNASSFFFSLLLFLFYYTDPGNSTLEKSCVYCVQGLCIQRMAYLCIILFT